jgi:hypothetical protein
VTAIFLALAGVATCAGYAVLEPELEADHRSWMISHFAVDYPSLGFVKRGLIGSLIDVAPAPEAARAVARLSLVMLVALLLGAAAFVRSSGAPLAVIVAFAVSPATFQNFAFDLGRFDQIGALLSLLSMLAIRRGIVWAAPAAAVLGVLIHEAFAVMFLPLVVAVGVVEGRVSLWLGPALSGAAATGAVLLFGGAEPALVADFFSRMGPDYYPPRIWISSLVDSVGYALGHALHPDTWRHVIAPSSAFLAANIAVLGIAIRGAAPRFLGLAIFALSPVALTAVGIDIPRWSAIAVFNLFAVALLVVRDGPVRLPWLLAGLSVLGPIGIAWPFPLWLSPVG